MRSWGSGSSASPRLLQRPSQQLFLCDQEGASQNRTQSKGILPFLLGAEQTWIQIYVCRWWREAACSASPTESIDSIQEHMQRNRSREFWPRHKHPPPGAWGLRCSGGMLHGEAAPYDLGRMQHSWRAEPQRVSITCPRSASRRGRAQTQVFIFFPPHDPCLYLFIGLFIHSVNIFKGLACRFSLVGKTDT